MCGALLSALCVLLLAGWRADASLSCPHLCFCNTPNKIVYCSRRNLAAIPTRIPAESRQLMLTGNLFQSNLLRRANLSSFTSLEHLYLSECGLEYVESDTFIDLRKLGWLDLSNNRIKILPDFTFRGLSLMHLFLHGNRGITLRRNSFGNLASIGLYLNDCSLKHISVDVLTPLNHTLKKLWLNGNEIEKIDKSFLPLCETLNHIRLGGNPLHCNCEMVWLKGFYDRKPAIFTGAPPPSCYTPKAIETRYFNDLAFTDFKCQAPVFSNIDASINNDNTGRLRCTAHGDPLPALYWIKPRGQMIRFAPPPAGVVSYNEGILRISQAARDVSGQYKCLASNAAGNVTLNVNVTWSRTTLPPTLPGPRGDTGLNSHHQARPGKGQPQAPPPHQAPGPSDTPARGGAHTNNKKYQPQYNHSQSHITVETSLGKDEKSPPRGGRRPDRYDDHHHPDWAWGHGPMRYFSLSELIGAVIGTFVATLLLCLLCMSIYYRHKWRTRYPRDHYYDRAYDRAYDRGSKLYVATDRDERMYMSKLPEHEHIYESPKR